MHRIAFLLVFSSLIARADDITLTDGTVYKDAKIVGHDAVNATLLYADGGATVPLAKLPADLQHKLGYNPAHAGAVAAPTASEQSATLWKDYRQALDKYVVIDGKFVNREASGVKTLNVKLNHVAEVKDSSGQSLGRGSFVDLADPTPGAAPTAPIAAPPTESTLYLKGYILNDDKPVKVDVVKAGATETGGLYYAVIEPFDFDFWKKAGTPK